jgi:hypothetical protein
MNEKPTHPIPPDRFATMVPSSKASPKPPKPKPARYTITVQRRERSGRWNQVATWAVTTDEEDMNGPLSMGLKPNYRILVNAGPPPEDASVEC